VARWALCVCLLTITTPLHHQAIASADAQPGKDIGAKKAKRAKKAKKAKKGVRRCVRFTQTLGSDEESVDLELVSECKFEVDCSVQWELQCSSPHGDEPADESSEATTLSTSESFSLNASASSCDLDWEIKNVTWKCVAS
jgi:hypothetical protein